MIRFRRFVSTMLALIIAFTMTACGSSDKGSTPEEISFITDLTIEEIENL